MTDKQTIDELKKLQSQALTMKTKLVELIHNRRAGVDESIAAVRLENFDDDVATIISDLENK